MTTLKISEMFTSIQGESTYTGKLCFFIRLAGCNLDCSYCDTLYAKEDAGSTQYSIDEIIERVIESRVKTVEITGGEPLLQQNVIKLLQELLGLNLIVLLETNGSISLKDVPDKVVKIVDIKCPSSGMSDKMNFNSFRSLNSKDQVKFVLQDYDDYKYACSKIKELNLFEITENILFSPVYGKLPADQLAEWMVEDRSAATLQIQLHKIIWDPEERGR